jgi:glycogen synthase
MLDVARFCSQLTKISGWFRLEAHSYGRPVIALGKGGALETVVGSYYPARYQKGKEEPVITGVFFSKQSVDSLAG